MSVARTWFDSLDAEQRALVLQVIAIESAPSDLQLEEAPEIIAPRWKLDAIGIPAAKQAGLRAVIGELARRLQQSDARPSRRRR